MKAKAPSLPFDVTIPRQYHADSVFRTHLLNGLNLINPLGERFFIRSVRHYMPEIEDDPALMRDVQKFVAQESRHGREHERFCRILEAQGYEIAPFLAYYKRIAYRAIEPRLSPRIRLSLTVALEHFTAILGERALRSSFLAPVHPVMRDLFRWHAAEEIEHKSVAFDVLKRVDGSYVLRIAGLMLATVAFFTAWVGAALALTLQERRLGTKVIWQDVVGGVREGVFGRGELARAFFKYFRPGFHPNDLDNAHLADAYFAERQAAGR